MDERHEFQPQVARGSSGYAVVCGYDHDHVGGGCHKGQYDDIHFARNPHRYVPAPEGSTSIGCVMCTLPEEHTAHAVGPREIGTRSFTGIVGYHDVNGVSMPHLRIRAAGRMVNVSVKSMLARLELGEGDEAEVTIRAIRRLPDTSGTLIDTSPTAPEEDE